MRSANDVTKSSVFSSGDTQTVAVSSPDSSGRSSTVRVSVDARGWALGILATVAMVFALSAAKVFFISLLTGILLAFMLDPVVSGLVRLGLRRAFGATLVMVCLIAALVTGAYALKGPIVSVIDNVPSLATKLTGSIAALRGDHSSGWQRLQNAVKGIRQAATLEAPTVSQTQADKAADKASDRPADSAPQKGSAKPHAETASANSGNAADLPYGNLLLSGSLGALGFAGQASMVAFLVYFLLLAGNTFKRKLVRLAGDSFSQKKITVQIIDDINGSVQRYMIVLVVTNLIVGVLTWLLLIMLGFENAAGLGVAAGLLHVIPYFGPAVTAVLLGVTGLVQADQISTAVIAAAGSVAIAFIVGMLVTTWMTGRIAKMNATAVFVSLLFWGWLWGVWGLLLGIPIIVIIKVISEHVQEMEAISELLGE